ncbi:hypothetical protein RhoFasSB10_03941 [Rhodococcus fascians]|nr:hypothetical protein [Rhodococcus fascians]
MIPAASRTRAPNQRCPLRTLSPNAVAERPCDVPGHAPALSLKITTRGFLATGKPALLVPVHDAIADAIFLGNALTSAAWVRGSIADLAIPIPVPHLAVRATEDDPDVVQPAARTATRPPPSPIRLASSSSVIPSPSVVAGEVVTRNRSSGSTAADPAHQLPSRGQIRSNAYSCHTRLPDGWTRCRLFTCQVRVPRYRKGRRLEAGR